MRRTRNRPTRLTLSLPAYLQPSENTALLVLAIAVGVLSGFAAVAFHLLIEGVHELVHLGQTAQSNPIAKMAITVLSPALGGLVAGTIIWLLARHDHGHGTAAVMEAVALRGGRLGVRPLLTKVFAAGLLIGTGGSAGPEDPSVQIGAAVGSGMGQRLHLVANRVRTLVASGVASAIAAVFNAPIAGVFFALEIVAGEFSTTLFAPVVLAAVSASVVSRSIVGEDSAFQVPDYTVINPFVEIPLYAVLGLIAAAIGTILIHAVLLSEAAFQRLRLPGPMTAALGGLLVGLLGLLAPGVLGIGYESTEAILNGIGPVGLALLVLLAAKLIATAITVGSAGIGGTFAPSLVLGATMGGLFGQIVTQLFPGLTAPPAAYALVGMGAVLVAVVRAPITAVLLLFEITGDYRIILPIMASVVISSLVAHQLHPESIYTERLARRGIQLRFGRDVNILEVVTVGEAMTRRFDTVSTDMTIRELTERFDQTKHHGFPMVDSSDKLCGIVTLTDLQLAIEHKLPVDTPIDQIATYDLIIAYPDQSLNEALRALGTAGVGRLPVVERADPQHLLGVLRRNDIVNAYQLGAIQRDELDQRLQQMRVSSHSGTHLLEVTITETSAAVGRAIRDLHLPRQSIITSIHRGGQSIIPNGMMILHANDRLTILTSPDQEEQVRTCFAQHVLDETTLRYHELTLSSDAAAIGRMVAELDLPFDALIVALNRDGQSQTVHGQTQLKPGDELTILAHVNDLPKIIECLIGAKESGV
ncbi:MAG: chloride channel protein [Chloroflexales bacterium]|nr:chloride channel protein [Chloroflexales bacterium]